MVLMDLQSRRKPWSKNTFTLRTTLTLSLKTGGREKSHVFQVTFFLFFFFYFTQSQPHRRLWTTCPQKHWLFTCVSVCVKLGAALIVRSAAAHYCDECEVSCVCVCVTHQSQRWPLVSCVLCKNLSEIKTINKEIILSSWLALTEIILLHSTCTVHEHTHTRTQKSTCWVFADRNDLEENLF